MVFAVLLRPFWNISSDELQNQPPSTSVKMVNLEQKNKWHFDSGMKTNQKSKTLVKSKFKYLNPSAITVNLIFFHANSDKPIKQIDKSSNKVKLIALHGHSPPKQKFNFFDITNFGGFNFEYKRFSVPYRSTSI